MQELPNSQEKRAKHDYTSELELKCLLIRINNKRSGKTLTEKHNSKIQRYISLYNKLNNIKYKDTKSTQRKIRLREKLKSLAISLSKESNTNKESYERFGEIILLMIKNILKKPNFSGYTYTDEFYSDAIHKIIKYMHNFDSEKISKSTGVQVNAFAYVSQIIHNSILFIIISKNKEQDSIKEHIKSTIATDNIDMKEYEINNESRKITRFEMGKVSTDYYVDIKSTLLEELEERSEDFKEKKELINIIYNKNYRISFEEYNKICEFIASLKSEGCSFNIIRNKKRV